MPLAAPPMLSRRLASALASTSLPAAARLETPRGGRRAAIAALFRVDATSGCEHVLVIKRATSERDPWVGSVLKIKRAILLLTASLSLSLSTENRARAGILLGESCVRVWVTRRVAKI